MIISRDFFKRDTLTVAKELVGCRLKSHIGGIETSGIIVETEAYLGALDSAAHSYKGKTDRVRALYGEKGRAYIYLIYGKYWCLNISTGPESIPECVLIRALEPVSGLEAMISRRGTQKNAALLSGPGKLCMALGITGENYGDDLCLESSPLQIHRAERAFDTVASKRIGIDYAGKAKDYLWRFAEKDSLFLSRKP